MSRRSVVAAGLALALVVALVVVRWPQGSSRHVRAQFTRAVGLYRGSDVRVLGVKVGEVTKVTPHGDRVVVDMAYDEAYKIPADAKAVVISPAVVGDRYVQLTPVYRSGPSLAEDATIRLRRTAVPVELDRIFGSLNDLDVALGPQGANKNGALSRLLAVGADNLGGQGSKVNHTLTDLSRAVHTLSAGRGDLFSTVRNLQVFTAALAGSDSEVAAFNTDLASVADQLAGEHGGAGAGAEEPRGGARGGGLLRAREPREPDDRHLGAGRHHRCARQAERRPRRGPGRRSGRALEPAERVQPQSGTLDTRDNAQQLDDPSLYLCSLLTSLGQPKKVCDQIDRVLKNKQLPEPGALVPSGPGAPDRTLGGILGGSR